MTNAWIDEDLYREPWVRSVGPIALHVYLAATNFIHREAREEHILTRQELKDAYPWEISDTDFEASLQRLVARDRVVLNGDEIELPMYEFEQEDNAKRKDRRAQNRRNAVKGMRARQRDEAGRLIPKHPANVQRVAGSSQRNGSSALVDPASYPIQSNPSDPITPPSAAPAPPEKPSKARKTHPNYTAVIALADRIVFQATGEKITWGLPKNRKAADTLARSASLEEIESRLKRAFVDRKPDWLWRGGPLTFTSFVSSFDAFVVVGAAQSDRVVWSGPFVEPSNGARS